MADETTGRERRGATRKRVHRATRLQRRGETSEARAAADPGEQNGGGVAAAEPEAVEEPEQAAEPVEPEPEPEAQEEPEPDEPDQAEPEPDEPEPVAEERGDDEPAPRRVGVAQLADIARAHLQELIGRPATAVLGVERRDGRWVVEVETLELERIPETTSVMGLYHVILDDDGEIMEFSRTARYTRSQLAGDG